MPLFAYVGLVGLALGILGSLAAMMRMLGRVELKLEMIWEWYLLEHAQVMVGGRRRTDPREPELAHDDGSQGADEGGSHGH